MKTNLKHAQFPAPRVHVDSWRQLGASAEEFKHVPVRPDTVHGPASSSGGVSDCSPSARDGRGSALKRHAAYAVACVVSLVWCGSKDSCACGCPCGAVERGWLLWRGG